MTSNPKPTILLAHGSFHAPEPYTTLLTHLSKHGYQIHCPQLPCADRKYLVADPSNPSFDQPPPPAGLPQQTQDAEVIKSLLQTLIEDEGKEVLLLAHSSGGWAASETAIPEYQREKRREEGKSGGVIGIFYMASFLIMVGESVWSTFAASTERPAEAREKTEWFRRLQDRNLTVMNEPEYYFFHDLPPAEAEKWSKTTTACPFLTSPLINDAYSALPCAYMLCEGDRVVPLWYQKLMIGRAEERSGRKLEIYKCAGGHESFLSEVDLYVDSIVDFAGKCG